MEQSQTPTEEPIIQLSPEMSSKKEQNYMLPAAILITGILIAGSVVYSKTPSAPRVGSAQDNSIPGIDILNTSETKKKGTMNPINSGDHIRGNPNAPIMVVEYSDLECPYCKVFHETMQTVMSVYGTQGKVSWVYRHNPIDGLHSKARAEAQATECAGVVGGNDKFWQYIDEIFSRTNSNDSLDPAELSKIARDISINEVQFATCVSSGQTAAKVSRDGADAMNIGARGTPYGLLINTKTGKVSEIPGAVPYEALKKMIDMTLSQM